MIMESAVLLFFWLALAILGPEAGAVTPYLLDPNCAKEVNLHVVHGQNASILGNPWMAQIILGRFFICGGSLISSRYVLTAAHCRDRSNQGLKVRLGEYSIGTQFDCTNEDCIQRPKDYSVSQTFIYKEYAEPRTYDLALIRLKTAVTYGVHIRSVCLLMGGNANWRLNLLQNIPRFNVTGWDRTANTTVSFPLQQAELQHYDNRFCIGTFSRQLDHNHICAGNPDRHTCNGNSGGPLTAKAPSVAGNHIVLFGVVSYGFQQCNGPTVFTNVLFNADWILWHIKHYP